jgi:hypothetical protein
MHKRFEFFYGDKDILCNLPSHVTSCSLIRN